jgi:hypothetical protein
MSATPKRSVTRKTQHRTSPRAAHQALALAQQEKSAWNRADLVKRLGRTLPRTGRDP